MSDIVPGSMGEQVDVPQVPVFTVANLPGNPRNWDEYRKTVPTHMLRMDGPFICETKDGPAKCSDGFLAVDEDGIPYPIPATVQAASFERIEQ